MAHGELQHLVVASLGTTDVVVEGLALRQVPEPRSGRPQPDLRDLATQLETAMADGPAVADLVRLPKLEPVLRAIVERHRPDRLGLVLVATEQDDAAFRHTDTAPLARLLCQLLPRWWAGLGRPCPLTAEAAVSEGNPADHEAQLRWAASVVERAVEVTGGGTVHLTVAGGTPAIANGLLVRFQLAHEFGRLHLLSWRPSLEGHVGRDARLDLLDRAAQLRHLRELAANRQFERLATITEDPASAAAALVAPTVHGLAATGAALLRIDPLGAATTAPPGWQERLGPLCFPTGQVLDGHEGAWDDLAPLHAYLLELAEHRVATGDVTGLLAVLYLSGEFMTHLAWQGVLGHAADPLRIGQLAALPGSLWGAERCPTSTRDREPWKAARRTTRWSRAQAPDLAGGERGFTVGELAGRLGRQLQTCATRTPPRGGPADRSVFCREDSCGVWATLGAGDRRRLATAARLVVAAKTSSLFKLRNTSPAGHFFATPPPDLVVHRWNLLAHQLRRADERAGVDISDLAELPAAYGRLLGCLAGGPALRPSTLLADLEDELFDLLAQRDQPNLHRA